MIAAEEMEARETDAVTRDQERYRIELPLIIKTKLEEAIAVELVPISERLKSLVLEIVRNAHDEYFDSVREICPSTAFRSGTPETDESAHLQSSPYAQDESTPFAQPAFTAPLNRMSSNESGDSGFASNNVLEKPQRPQIVLPSPINADSHPYAYQHPPYVISEDANINQFTQNAFEDMLQDTNKEPQLSSDFDMTSTLNSNTLPLNASAPANFATTQLHAEHYFPCFGLPITDNSEEAFLANFPAFEEYTNVGNQSGYPV
jgi:hypothetical protein